MSDDNSFYTFGNYNPYEPYDVGKYNPYEPYNVGKYNSKTKETVNRKSQLESEINKLVKEIKELEALNRIQENIKQVKSLPKSKAYATFSDKEKYDKIRQEIRKAATFGETNRVNNPVNSRSVDTRPSPPIINEVVRINDLKLFTDQTHGTVVRFVDNEYYTEQVESKVVGMEKVDWWEYVLIYGIFKALKISFEYTKLKEMIDHGMKTNRNVSGKLLEVKFIPKNKFDAIRKFDTINGQNVIRESGTKYESAVLLIEVPQNKVRKTQEYKDGFFIYEDTFDTLEIDYNKLLHNFDEIVGKYNIHESLKNQIKKNIITNGRLSGV